MTVFSDLVNLFYPKCCAACTNALVRQEEAICLSCQVSLPHAHINDERDNQIEKIFWLRADVQAATAFLRMPRHGMVHRLIHEMKYHNNPAVGKRLGKLFAAELMDSERMKDFDTIIPVPLHPKRLKARGYNQCEAIAEGMNEMLKREVSTDNLVRVRYNEKQAKTPGRWNRWENCCCRWTFPSWSARSYSTHLGARWPLSRRRIAASRVTKIVYWCS